MNNVINTYIAYNNAKCKKTIYGIKLQICDEIEETDNMQLQNLFYITINIVLDAVSLTVIR